MEDFYVNFANHDAKLVRYGTVLVHDITCRSAMSWIMELRLGIGLQDECESTMNCDDKNCSVLLLEKTMELHKPE